MAGSKAARRLAPKNTCSFYVSSLLVVAATLTLTVLHHRLSVCHAFRSMSTTELLVRGVGIHRASAANTDNSARMPAHYHLRHYHYNLTVLIPAYNEINRIGNTLYTYIDYMKHLPTPTLAKTTKTTGNCSILVVDDGSTDFTSQHIVNRTWMERRNNYNNCLHLPKKQMHKQHKNSASNLDRDASYDCSNSCWKINEHVSVISLPTNQGKGAAISRGMMELQQRVQQEQSLLELSLSSSRTTTKTRRIVRSIVLVADADGSGDISCINDMIQSLECLLLDFDGQEQPSTTTTPQNLAIIVGKRQYNHQRQQQKSILRSILSWGFRTCVSTLFFSVGNSGSTNHRHRHSSSNGGGGGGGNSNSNSSSSRRRSSLGVTDTQCGFKLMTLSTGVLLYHNLNLQRWSHDVEVLYRAKLLHVPVDECNVNWVDVDGSKLLVSSSSSSSSGGGSSLSRIKDAVVMSSVMLGEITQMRLLYALGVWK